MVTLSGRHRIVFLARAWSPQESKYIWTQARPAAVLLKYYTLHTKRPRIKKERNKARLEEKRHRRNKYRLNDINYQRYKLYPGQPIDGSLEGLAFPTIAMSSPLKFATNGRKQKCGEFVVHIRKVKVSVSIVNADRDAQPKPRPVLCCQIILLKLFRIQDVSTPRLSKHCNGN